MPDSAMTFLRAGITAAQDLGRPHGARHGFPAGGAMDQLAARTANALVGNRPDAVLLENTATGLSATFATDVLIAVTGAADRLFVDGLPRPVDEPVSVPAGTHVLLAEPARGLRSYLAVHGGVDAPTLLGSAAPDPVLGFGLHLRDGDTVALHRAFGVVDHPHLRHPAFRVGPPYPSRAGGATVVVDVTEGPDRAEFGDTGDRLFTGPFVVGDRSNAIGLRMSGHLPRRTATSELLSRGMPVGAVEVPAGDELVVLHRGRGVTAGYPVLAVATSSGLDRLAQCRPGDTVRFRATTVSRALTDRRGRQARVDDVAERVRAAFAAIGRPFAPSHPLPAAPAA